MKFCLKCNQQIKYIVVIDGKERNLQRRKYCLDCSPFKSGNTQKIHIPGVMPKRCFPAYVNSDGSIGRECTCEKCGKSFFYKRKGETLKTCAVCLNKQARRKMKRKCIEYKNNKCERCGYSKCDKALSFHHLNPEEKEFQISTRLTKDWEVIKVELDKCILVCSNCHMEIHEELEQ